MAVATAAVIGIGISAYSAQQSFSAAADAKADGEKAAAAASLAMSDAKKKAEKDFYGGLAVPLDAYDAAFENNLAVAQQSTEALQEGDARALAAGVGRVGAAAGANAEETRIAMGQEISDLNEMKATSKDAVNQQLIQMDVANAKQQNEIAAESKAAQNAANQAGLEGIAGVVSGVGSMAPLYSKKKVAPAAPGAGIEQDPFNIRSTAGLTLGGSQGSAFGSKKLGLGAGGNPFDNPFSKKPQFGNFSKNVQSPNFFSGSDRRLKEKIKLIGQSPSGLNIYSFKYKNEEGMYQGVMSDEIDQAAVIRVGKYDMVNYAMIDVEFKEI